MELQINRVRINRSRPVYGSIFENSKARQRRRGQRVQEADQVHKAHD